MKQRVPTYLFPRSLAGQLSVLLLVGIVAAHLVGLAIFSSETSLVRRAAARTQVLERVATLVRVTELAPPDLTAEIAAAFSSPRQRFWIAREGLIRESDMDAEEASLARDLQSRLSPQARAGRVRLVERDPDVEDGVDARDARRRPLNFQVSVQLADGSWLNGEVPLRQPGAWLASRLMTLLAISGLVILAIVALSVRWITRPLHALASAAERVGRGELVEPLRAEGPSEVRRTVAAFNAMQDRLIRFVRDRTRMLAAVSHDLRTPLTSLRLRAEMIDDDELRSGIVRTLDEMKHMVESTLAFARDDATREETRSVDLVALVETIVDDLGALGHAVSFDGPKSLPYRCRPIGLKRAVANLVENGVRYGGRARVTLSEAQDEIVIAVEDDGPGIPDDRLDEVFDPFVRIESSRSAETGGVGLGLAIARSTVRAHGGDLTLRNRPQGGLLAEIRLPAPSAQA